MTSHFLMSHPFGNNNAYHAALALWESGNLENFYTYVFRTSAGRARSFPQLAGAPVQSLYGEELLRLFCTQIPGIRYVARGERWVDRVARHFDQLVSSKVTKKHTHLYGYEDFCATSFARAKQCGVRCLYELPTTYHKEKQLILANASTEDEFLDRYLGHFAEPSLKTERKNQEIELADQIIVASTFSEQSILRHSPNLAERIVRVPYGVDVSLSAQHRPPRSGPLRLLFVGLISPRKGIHHLFGALQTVRSSQVKLSLAGHWAPGFQQWLTKRYEVPFTYLGRVPHSEMAEVYAAHDVLVFPSLFEGFGLVILEAMACGTPVITTERTGAPDIFADGDGGLIVPAGDVAALAQQIERLIENPILVQDLAIRALEIARERQWARYRRDLISMVGTALQTPA